MNKLLLATNNSNKLREIRQMLPDLEILSLEDMDINHEVIEDADTFAGNALKKAAEIAAISGIPTVADDSGLAVESLGGVPGVYSARYALDECTDGNIDNANNDKLLREMDGITDRRAKFVCALALVLPDGTQKIITEECHGEIGHQKLGTGGFGYDCLFFVPEYGCTTAQMSASLKNMISHRAKAIAKLIPLLKDLRIIK